MADVRTAYPGWLKGLVVALVPLAPALLYAAFLASSMLFYTIGGCEGALGSGVTCSRGDGFGTLALYAELSVFFVFPLVALWTAASGLVVLVIGLVFLLRRISGR